MKNRFPQKNRIHKNISFLKRAVMVLVEHSEIRAVRLLVNDFLKKNEQEAFYNLLPENYQPDLYD
jgi:hypothetical protein